jgi:spore coat protein U-like protein
MKKTWILAFILLAASGMAMAADTANVAVSANVTGVCKFVSGGSLAFGPLDPSSGSNVNGTSTDAEFWCTKGQAYTVTDDGGANKSGTTYRMKHATLSEYIPYSFSYSPASGTGGGAAVGARISLAFSGTVQFTDYQNASVGAYSDTVQLTINP